jgi:hypothetical protein
MSALSCKLSVAEVEAPALDDAGLGPTDWHCQPGQAVAGSKQTVEGLQLFDTPRGNRVSLGLPGSLYDCIQLQC